MLFGISFGYSLNYPYKLIYIFFWFRYFANLSLMMADSDDQEQMEANTSGMSFVSSLWYIEYFYPLYRNQFV